MSSVHFEKHGNVGVITIDNPPVNLTDNALLSALTSVLDAIDTSDTRALLLQAEGDHFGGGVNIKTTFVGVDSKGARRMLSRGVPTVTRIEGMDIPIVCAVQGLCVAAALEIALRCDVIIAADDARFAQVEQHIGAATFLGGAYLLAERCGPARAREICFTGNLYDAESFERWNIINRVVPRATLRKEAMEWAQQLANGPTRAHAANKRLVRAFLDHGVRAADELLFDLAPPIFDSEDFKAGVQAVVEHGARNFRGKVTFRGT
jgi:enoyl-CoA hydratase/carnithine racemase